MGKIPCCDKSGGLKKGPWTADEDQKLIDYIQKHGHGRWRTLPKNAGLKRCGKSCRLRWTNYLRPDIKRGRFSFEEEETIIQLHSILGNKWSAIAARLPGRTDNEIKNYWNTHIRKRLLRMGIDPVTHRPRLDLLEFSSVLNASLCNPPQLNLSGLLGVQPMANPNFLNPASNLELLLCQRKRPEFLTPNLQEIQLCNSQGQNHFKSLHEDQVKGTVQETCATSSSLSASFANQAQLMEANVKQHWPTSSNLGCQNSLPSLWQNDGEPSDIAGSLISLPYQDYKDSNQYPLINPLCENQTYQSSISNNIQHSAFGSVISTPSSSSTPLNSSPTTYVNNGIEDERDSYCSNNMLMFDNIPSFFSVDGFM